VAARPPVRDRQDDATRLLGGAQAQRVGVHRVEADGQVEKDPLQFRVPQHFRDDLLVDFGNAEIDIGLDVAEVLEQLVPESDPADLSSIVRARGDHRPVEAEFIQCIGHHRRLEPIPIRTRATFPGLAIDDEYPFSTADQRAFSGVHL